MISDNNEKSSVDTTSQTISEDTKIDEKTNSQLIIPTFTNESASNTNISSLNTIQVSPVTTGAERIQSGVLNTSNNLNTNNPIKVEPIQIPGALPNVNLNGVNDNNNT